MRVKAKVLLIMALFLVFSLAQDSQGKAKVDLKKVADNIIKTVNTRDATKVGQLYTEDATYILSGEPEPIRGRKAIAENFAGWVRAFPDVVMEFPFVLISGNHIVFEGVFRGTNTGPLTSAEGEIAPTGQSVALKIVFIARITPEGLIEEDRTYFDSGDFIRQLGLVK